MMESDHDDADDAPLETRSPNRVGTPSAWASPDGLRGGGESAAASSYGEVYEVPIHTEEEDHRPTSTRTHRTNTRSRSSKGTTTLENDAHSEELWNGSVKEMSIPDRIASTALAGTVEFLKQVGGVTLSTTGALVAPPLHITRTIVLPNLFAALKDFIASHSPTRLKDWFRIFSSSIYHIFNTLQNTETGHVFSNRIMLVLIDVLDCLSADTTRQLLLDGISCLVKFFDILQTPSFQSYCDQLGVTGGRLLDALSNGRNKLLLHDLKQAAISAGQLLADPATTVALAEVTAYLCYALEMEDQQIQTDERRLENAGSDVKSNQRSRNPRRKERDTFQRAAVLDRDTLDTGHTVEEVLLSSLGVPRIDPHSTDGTVPSSIVVEPRPPSSSAPMQDKDWTVDPLELPRPAPLEFHERARSDVNVKVLQEGIFRQHFNADGNARATNIPSTNSSLEEPHPFSNAVTIPIESTTNVEPSTVDVEELGVVYSVDENDDNVVGPEHARPCRPRATVKAPAFDDDALNNLVDGEREGDRHPISQLNHDRRVRKDGESAHEHFYRILDEILAQKRHEAVDRILANEIAAGTPHRGCVRRRPAVARDADGRGTIQERLALLRAQINTDSGVQRNSVRGGAPMVLKKTEKRIILAVVTLVVLLVCFWVAMGCYGLYIVFLQYTGRRSRSIGKVPSAPLHQDAPTRDIVIRVVKEVVHVNQDGTVLGQGSWKTTDAEAVVDLQKVAECVAAVYN